MVDETQASQRPYAPSVAKEVRHDCQVNCQDNYTKQPLLTDWRSFQDTEVLDQNASDFHYNWATNNLFGSYHTADFWYHNWVIDSNLKAFTAIKEADQPRIVSSNSY